MPTKFAVKRSGAAITIAAVVVTLVTACGALRHQQALSGCSSVPSSEVGKIMATARRNFMTGDTENDHMTFQSAAQYPMPPRLRAFGMTRIVTLVLTFWFSAPVSTQMGGVAGWAIFGSNDDGTKIYPLDDITSAGFALSTPTGAAWKAWTSRNVPHLVPLPAGAPPYAQQSSAPGDPAFEKALECSPINP